MLVSLLHMDIVTSERLSFTGTAGQKVLSSDNPSMSVLVSDTKLHRSLSLMCADDRGNVLMLRKKILRELEGF